jgi:hypothetical protein
MAEILKDLSKKGKKNLQDLPKDEPKYLTPASDKDIDVIKGDASESGSNSYAKSVQAAIKSLSKKLTPASDKDIKK